MKKYWKQFAEWATGSKRIAHIRAQFAHDLRNPLSIMKAELELALREENLTNSEMQKILKSNMEEVDRMTYILEELLGARSAENKRSTK